MHVLVLGKGGREHALIKLLSKSNDITKLYCLNGNPAMCDIATNLTGDETTEHIKRLCLTHHIDWVIPGGETHLSMGITDVLTHAGIHVFGPTKKAAQIESSKAYGKYLMEKYEIPTASYKLFSNYEEALNYIDLIAFPIVIKYDGLAFGKGVTIVKTKEDANNVLNDLLNKRIYGHGNVLIEEFLEGEEYSMICMVYHDQVIPLPLAKDYKARFENHEGPNTGGMGAYSPVSFVNEQDYEHSLTIMKKTAQAMMSEENPFVGFLYGGFIKTSKGPKIIEYNCRLGDPETEVILPRIDSDFFKAIKAITNQQPVTLKINSKHYLGVVMVSDGYPGNYPKGYQIKLPDKDYIIHMGTSYNNDQLVATGGRVLLVLGSGDDLEEAKKNAYSRLMTMDNPTLKYRKDIGQ